MEFLDFKVISEKVPIKSVLDFLCVPYSETNEGIKGQVEGKFNFIAFPDKNKYVVVPNGERGYLSVINFYQDFIGVSAREAAAALKKEFLTEKKEPKREIPTLKLKYHQWLKDKGISEELAKDWQIGLPEGRCVLAGKIAFFIDKERGYIGYDLKKEAWFFPKGFRRDTLYNLDRVNTPYVILAVSPLDVCHLHSLGFPFALALMAKSATDEQIKLISTRYKRVLIIHPDPGNIASRLNSSVFVKAPGIPEDIIKMTAENIKSLF
jgi:hypothetical protein